MNTNAVNQVAENVSGYTESEKSSKVSEKTIGEPKLSDKAKEYYEKLKKKFSTMDFILVSKDMKETAKANAGQYANANKMVVLIDEEKIERMAEDESYRKQYEGIIANASSQLATMQSRFANGQSGVKAYGIQVNDGGNASFFAVVDKSLSLQKKRIEKKQEENRAERKKAQKEAYEKRMNKEDEDTSSVKKSDKTDSMDKTGKSEDLVTVTAGSLEELEKKIQDMLYDSMSDYVFTPQEKQVGWNVDFRG